ncbi:hypothetical protein [Asticcacaulis sp. AND118]|uniref:hypothetical protein n=1 Tax=Asticcacaulis sp. AND118 TaxID=2840468 RepID=UPI001CFFD1CA|nr:hypothetical protein [Asticcacaulis sp. AND118]UDF04625.1 hypothetical protein LH365_06190 [Asticcacaulis sp. AND118]
MKRFPPALRNGLIVFVFLLPLLSGVLGKIARSNAWFGDYRAVACGAQKIIDGGALYDLNLKCDGLEGTTAVYVYLPVVAEAFASVIRVIGQDGLIWVYGAIYIVSLAGLLGVTYLSPALQSGGGGAQRRRGLTKGDAPSVFDASGIESTSPAVAGEEKPQPTLLEKIPFAAFLTGSAVVWGNIAVLCHAAVLASALLAKRFPWLFAAVVALCGVIKPVFLTYLLVLLFLDIPLWKRLGWSAAAAAAGLLPTLLFAAEGSALSESWRATLAGFVYTTTPGESFYGWLGLLGLRADSLAANLGWLVFAGLIAVSGLALAEGLKLDTRARIWLGLSLGVLTIPRLMSQDVFLIGVGLAYVALYSPALTAASKPLAFLKDRGRTILTVICVVCLIGGAAELGDYTTRIATLLLSLYVLAIGGLTVVQRRQAILTALFPRKTAR